MQVEAWPIGRVKPYPGNPRSITDRGVDKVASSIREFGFNQPIVVDKKGVVIVGHTRLRAAEKLGLKEVPVLVADLPAGKARAYRLADNRTHEEAGWIDELLRVEFDGLKALDLDLSMVTGFDAAEIRRVFSATTVGHTDPDDVPAPPKAPVARVGDMWQLGPHRLICGDCTDPTVVVRVLDDAKPNLMVTDPPYGVSYDPAWRDELGIDWQAQSKKTQRRKTHPNAKPISSRALGKVENDDRADWREAWALFPGRIAYVWHGGIHAGVVLGSLAAEGFTPRAQIIWVKQHFVFSRGDYHWQHEPCWYAVRGSGHWTGDRKQTTVWEIANASAFHGKKDDHVTGHGTQKPVECMKRPMMNNSSQGEAVYDPFMGSGTTIIAAEMADRIALGVELNPAYVDVAIIRWQNFTGKVATLDGVAFSEVERKRGKDEGGTEGKGRGRGAASRANPNGRDRSEVHAGASEKPARDEAEAPRGRRARSAARAGG